jgi:hypothetical protein
MKDREKDILLALETDAKTLVNDLQRLFAQNPLIFSAVQDDTDIVHRIVMIEAKLANLEAERKVISEKDRVAEIIHSNLDSLGILDADDSEDINTRRELIASILYDMEKYGLVFRK